jgi:glycosyltransferase involved in cell wall biosynthesis
MAAPVFTVFTATYQRAHTLGRVRDSLAAQTMRDFEWLVVDDGSTDGTEALLREWTSDSPYPIRVIRQENLGKPVAWNRGVAEARGELFLSIDSDDACVPIALERFLHHWQSISEASRARFSAVTALAVDQHGRVLGDRFPDDVTDSDPLEIRFRYGVRGEKWGFHRIEVLREFPFPDPGKGRWVDESLVWDRIGRSYRTRYVNEELLRHHIGTEGGLMSQVADAQRHSAMFLEVFRERLNEDLRYARWAPGEFVRTAANYSRHARHQRLGVIGQLRALRPGAWPLWALGAPVGAALWARDRRRSRR